MDYYIQTPCGPLVGCAGRIPGVAAYKGIRYATAERWTYPTPVTHWDGLYDATGYGPCCYQPRAFADEAAMAGKAFYYNEFRRGETYLYSEDCLFLNVFAPEDAREGDGLPVLVYIHGGGFTGGCGHEKHFDCPVWPLKGVIGVTLNYRLGPLGFLALPELKQEAGLTGNYGLFDQLAALEWVRANIASFGGDPERITIMGQSAGAMSVQQLCLSPLTQGLFQAAVMSSGGGSGPLFEPAPPEKQYDFWHETMSGCGCADLAGFRQAPVEQLFAVWQNLKKSMEGGRCFPCRDGRLVVEPAQQPAKAIPYLIGSTSRDIVPLVLHQMARAWCARQEKKSYAWFFDRNLPGDDQGAWHSSDLWYWFGTLDNCWRPMTKKDFDLSRQMTDYLTNFCKFADPNGAGLPAWLPTTSPWGKVLRLGEGETRMGAPSLAALMVTTLTNKAVGE